MKTISQEEYTKLNKALYELEDLLGCLGVKEFSLSNKKHSMQMDFNAENIDTDLLSSFCSKIGRIHFAKFGRWVSGHEVNQ